MGQGGTRMVGEFRGRELGPCHRAVRAVALLSTGHVSNVSCSRNTVIMAVLLQYRLLVSRQYESGIKKKIRGKANLGRASADCEISGGALRRAFNDASLSLQQSTYPKARRSRNSTMSVVGATTLFGQAQDRFSPKHFMLSLVRKDTSADELSPSFKNASPTKEAAAAAAAAAFRNSSSSQSSIWRLRNYTFARSLVPSFSRRPLQHRWKQHLGHLGLMVGALFSSLQAVFSP